MAENTPKSKDAAQITKASDQNQGKKIKLPPKGGQKAEIKLPTLMKGKDKGQNSTSENGSTAQGTSTGEKTIEKRSKAELSAVRQQNDRDSNRRNSSAHIHSKSKADNRAIKQNNGAQNASSPSDKSKPGSNEGRLSLKQQLNATNVASNARPKQTIPGMPSTEPGSKAQNLAKLIELEAMVREDEDTNVKKRPEVQKSTSTPVPQTLKPLGLSAATPQPNASAQPPKPTPLPPLGENVPSSMYSKINLPPIPKTPSGVFPKPTTLPPLGDKISSGANAKSVLPASDKISSGANAKSVMPASDKISSGANAKSVMPANDKISSGANAKSVLPASDRSGGSLLSKSNLPNARVDGISNKPTLGNSVTISSPLPKLSMSTPQPGQGSERTSDSNSSTIPPIRPGLSSGQNNVISSSRNASLVRKEPTNTQIGIPNSLFDNDDPNDVAQFGVPESSSQNEAKFDPFMCVNFLTKEELESASSVNVNDTDQIDNTGEKTQISAKNPLLPPTPPTSSQSAKKVTPPPSQDLPKPPVPEKPREVPSNPPIGCTGYAEREYTDEEVAAVLEGSEAPLKVTMFATPQTTPDVLNAYEELSYDAKNVDLEKGQNLPEQLEDIINAYDDEIKHSQTRDTVREHTLHLAIARILEHAGYEKLAYVRYLKALEANGYSLTAIHELRRIARAYDKLKDVATLIQSELDIDISKSEQSIYLEEYARIVQFMDGQSEDAIRCLHRASALTPDSVGPLSVLVHILIQQQRWEEVLETLSKIASLTDSREERAAFYSFQAYIANYKLNHPRLAITRYLQTIEEAPQSITTFNEVLSLLIQLEHWQMVHKLVVDFADNTNDKSLSQSVLLLDGGIATDKLGDQQVANQTFERAYNLNTTDPTALDMLIDNFASNHDQWAPLDHIFARLEELSANPKEHTDYTCLRAVTAQYNNRPSAEIEAILAKGFEVCPQNPFIQSMYLDLLMATGNYQRVEDIFSKIMAENGTEETSYRFTMLGVYYQNTLRNTEKAIACFRKALSGNPFDRRAFENLEIIYREAGHWDDLHALYQRRLSVIQDAKQRASLLYSMATLCENNLRHYEEAINYYKQYREIYPDDICAIHRLQIVYRMTKNWLGLCEMLLVEKDMSLSAPERCNLLLRVAEVCVNFLNKKEFAINQLMLAREENPQNFSVYKLLCQILAEKKRWLEYVNVLNDVIRYLPSSNDKVTTLCKIGIVYEQQLSDDISAISSYERVLKLDPTNIFAIKKLEIIYKKTRNISAYYDLVLRTNPFIASPTRRARRLYLVALKFITVLDDYASAIEVLESALSFQPDSAACGQLLSICYLITKQYDRMIKYLHNATTFAKTQDTKSECAFELANLYVWIYGNYADAVHPLELALALRPSLSSARQLLISVQDWMDQTNESALLYLEAAQSCTDKALAISYYKTAADIAHFSSFESKPNAVDEIGALKRILELDPNEIIANERLEAMEPNRANLVPFFEKRLRNATPDDEIELKLSIAESIYSNQPQHAFAIICEIIEKKPFHIPALRMAANTALHLNNITLACRYLDMQAKSLENIGMRIIAWCQASELAQKRLNKPDLAINYMKQAFLLAPHRMDLCDKLVELLSQQHDLQQIDNTLQIHVRSISKSNRISRFMQMADLYMNDLKEPAQAAVKLRQALEIDHNNLETYKRLIQLEISQQHYHEASCAIESMLELDQINEVEATEARYTLSELYIEQLHRSRQAIPLLQKILTDKQDDVRALKLLSRVYFDEGKYHDSLAICMNLNKFITPPENISILLQMATIYKILNEPEKIAETLDQAVSIVPLDATRVLNEIEPWIQTCNELSIIRNFVESLVKLEKLSAKDQLAIYIFAAKTYLSPLNMRFQADELAIKAANFAPDSIDAQMLAAKVFNPKVAIEHAFKASKLQPFSVAPYNALLDIAVNSHSLDMQARIEQQLALIDGNSHLTNAIQNAYISHQPERGSITRDILYKLAPPIFNPHIQQLFQLAGPRLCPPPLVSIQTESIEKMPKLKEVVRQTAAMFGFDQMNVRLAMNIPFVFGADYETNDGWLINAKLLDNISEAECRYHIATGMAAAALGVTILDAINFDDIVRFSNNLLGLVYDNLVEPPVTARIKQILSRKDRRNIIDFVKSYDPSVFSFDPVKQCYAIEIIEARIGLICCTDLNAAISGVLRRKLPNTPIADQPNQRLIQCTQVPIANDLLHFNLSDDIADIRQKLGIYLKISG